MGEGCHSQYCPGSEHREANPTVSSSDPKMLLGIFSPCLIPHHEWGCVCGCRKGIVTWDTQLSVACPVMINSDGHACHPRLPCAVDWVMPCSRNVKQGGSMRADTLVRLTCHSCSRSWACRKEHHFLITPRTSSNQTQRTIDLEKVLS